MTLAVLIVVGTTRSTVKEMVNCSLSSQTLSSVMLIVKHALEVLLTVATSLFSGAKSVLPANKGMYTLT